MDRILVISPHPDDETLGCGGTILKHKATGDEIYWCIVTNISAENGYGESRIDERQREVDIVSGRYCFDYVTGLNYPTTKLDTISMCKLVDSLSRIINLYNPNIVYLPNRSDVHSDHRIVFEAVMSATKTFRFSFIRKLLSYEVLSETEFAPPFQSDAFVPNFYSDITEYLDKKVEIMGVYEGEMGKVPFPRSPENIKALAMYRGATAGVKYAEAFMMLKEIW